MGDTCYLDNNQQYYRDWIDTLRTASDARFGITSKRVSKHGQDTWVRDATQALALDDSTRPSHDDVSIQANHAMIRCLTRARAIDYAIAHHDDPSWTNEEREQINREKTKIRQKIKTGLNIIKNNVLLALDEDTLPQCKHRILNNIETKFNDFLIVQLHDANLTQGCSTKKHAEALLAHYKVLYSVLDPAMPLVTLSYDQDTQILQRETQYPVTEKTEFQKAYKDTLETVISYPLGEEVNAHTVHNAAKQKADKCFVDFIVADDRMWTSQARKSHLVGVKNAFLVKVETVKAGAGACKTQQDLLLAEEDEVAALGDDKPLWLGRMGTPVYVGKGEKYTDAHVKANIEQLQMAVKKYIKPEDELTMHFTTLNTDTNMDGEKQDAMIAGLRKAMKEKKLSSKMSVVPANDIGTTYRPELVESLQKNSNLQAEVQAGRRADRLDFAVDVVLEADKQANTLSFVNCAGGADRTGTVIEAAIQKHTAERMQIEKDRVGEMRARSFNAAEITTQMVPGTPGMKPCSKANNWFGWGRRLFYRNIERELYLESADLNKKNKVKHVDCFDRPSEALMREFKANEDRLKDVLKAMDEHQENKDSLHADMRRAASRIITQAQSNSAFKAKEYAEVSEIYKLVTGVLELTYTKNMDEKILNNLALDLKRIDAIRQRLSVNETLQRRIEKFVCSVLVAITAVILLSIPWFHSIYIVASLVMFISTLKVGVSLGFLGKFASPLMLLSSPPASDEILPGHDVMDKTKIFTAKGEAFFKKHKDELQGSREKTSEDPESKGNTKPQVS